MLKNTPAGYKKEYPWLKEVDSLALANVQLNLEGAFRKFFREPGVGFPHYKSKKHSRKSYTTNMVNGNICLQDRFLKLPKMQPVKIKLHRMIPEMEAEISDCEQGTVRKIFCQSAVRL